VLWDEGLSTGDQVEILNQLFAQNTCSSDGVEVIEAIREVMESGDDVGTDEVDAMRRWLWIHLQKLHESKRGAAGAQSRVSSEDMDVINRHRRRSLRPERTRQEFIDLGFTEQEIIDMAHNIRTHGREYNRISKKAPAKPKARSRGTRKSAPGVSSSSRRPATRSTGDAELDALFADAARPRPGAPKPPSRTSPDVAKLLEQSTVVRAPRGGGRPRPPFRPSVVQGARGQSARSSTFAADSMQRAANADKRELVRKLMKD
jgi:hypothetical protein